MSPPQTHNVINVDNMGFFSMGGQCLKKCPKFKLALDLIGLAISATGLALGFVFDINDFVMVLMLLLDMLMTAIGFIEAGFTIIVTFCAFLCTCCKDGKKCCRIICCDFIVCVIEFALFAAGFLCGARPGMCPEPAAPR